MLELTLPDGVDDAKYPLAHSNTNDGPQLGPIKLIEAGGDVFTAVFVLRPATNDPITATCPIRLALYFGDYSEAQCADWDDLIPREPSSSFKEDPEWARDGKLEWSTGSGVQLVSSYEGEGWDDETKEIIDAAWGTAVAWACRNGDLLYRRAMRLDVLQERNLETGPPWELWPKVWWWTALEPGLVRDLAANLRGLPGEEAEDLRRIVLGTLALSEDDAPPMPDWQDVAAEFDKLVKQ